MDLDAIIAEEESLGLISSLERSASIPTRLYEAQQKAISFGNTFLDAGLFGILPNDLILLGAPTSIGKTAMCCEIAKNVSLQGRRVCFVALEAEEDEVEMRIEYQLYAKRYFLDSDRKRGINFDYRSYRFNKLKDYLWPYTEDVVEEFTHALKNVTTIYRKRSFTIHDLEYVFRWAKDNSDLVIIDHLHYFDFAKDASSNTNERMSDLMKGIRDLNLTYNVPVILVAHLRKDFNGVVPQINDFMGSSDIQKVATCAVMLSKFADGFDPVNQTSKTVISVPKARTGSLGVVGVQNYALRVNAYEKPFEVGIVGKDKIRLLKTDELPYWAKSNDWATGVDVGGVEDEPHY